MNSSLRQQDHVVDDARGHVDGVGGPFAHQLLDLFLEVGEVAGEGALPAGARVALSQYFEELALVIVRGDLGVDLEALHVGLVELVGLPHAAGNRLAHLHRLLILHIGELVVEGTQQEHDGGEALLAVDDLQLTGGVLEGDDGTEEVLVVLAVESLVVVPGEGEGEQVVPQRRALVLAPGVGALVVGDEEVRLLVG